LAVPFARERPRQRRLVHAALVAALLLPLAGCDVGTDRLRCTLDPASIAVTGSGAVCAASLALDGRAFDYGRCGAPCPPPWSVTVTWRNQATGESGKVPGTFHTVSCWPFYATACSGADFGATVPLAPGLNQIELEADEGDGFTACTVVRAERTSGC
jgi:hypothetical protein